MGFEMMGALISYGAVVTLFLAWFWWSGRRYDKRRKAEWAAEDAEWDRRWDAMKQDLDSVQLWWEWRAKMLAERRRRGNED